MEFHQLKCPNCGATLAIENGLDTFFCQYCGTKLIADGQSDMAIRAKADIILANKALERERQQQEYEERKTRSENKSTLIGLIVLFIAMVLWVVIMEHI